MLTFWLTALPRAKIVFLLLVRTERTKLKLGLCSFKDCRLFSDWIRVKFLCSRFENNGGWFSVRRV